MYFTYKEKVTFTKEEATILDKARILLDEVYMSASHDRDIETMACVAMENICDLLSDEYSDIE